jgi:ribosomal protein L40E
MDLVRKHVEEEKICPNPDCGALNKATASICIRCGREFKNE